jgi:NAD(P)-dependent dehydrogenase (short-subunit alcohol dehydrogenase family)
MTGKVVLVTGGTSGIGKQAARELAARGAHVALVGRDAARTDATAREIKAGSDGADREVDGIVADLASQESVRALAAQVTARYQRLDVLVNCAGGYYGDRHTTVDGLERTFALNHMAYFLLTNLLLDLLTASAPARIVTVASDAQRMGRIDFDDLQGERRYSGQRAYSQSKLANVLFTYELARRLEGTGVTATVLHPGVVRTNFGRDNPNRLMRAMTSLATPFMKTPERGAETVVYLAASPDVEGVTGQFFVNRKARSSSKRSYDRGTARRLWTVSEQLAGLTV